jgi:hypothetical protein
MAVEAQLFINITARYLKYMATCSDPYLAYVSSLRHLLDDVAVSTS